MVTWTCTACQFPIADGEGVVAVPLEQISDMPMFGPEWTSRHTLCAGDLNDYYGIDVEELRTHEGVLRWTAHLLSKVWLANSNWDEIIRSTIKGADAPCG